MKREIKLNDEMTTELIRQSIFPAFVHEFRGKLFLNDTFRLKYLFNVLFEKKEKVNRE
jgi:hypothetical protein